MEIDDTLVDQAKEALAGDTRAFEVLIGRHQGKILANCRYLTGSPDDAQDLAQEVFVKAYFGLRRFEGRSGFGSWIQKIKVNHCLNFLRTRKGRAFIDVDDPLSEIEPELQISPNAERDLNSRDDQDRIREVLDQLPDTLRVPLLLRDLDGMSYQEIAGALNIGLSAVKMRIKRAREVFRQIYADRKQTQGG